MIVDGKQIAVDLYEKISGEIDGLNDKLHLTVLTCAPNFETQKYLSLKKRKAEELGISVNVIELPEDVTTEEVVISLKCATPLADGLVVQLPFPEQVDIDKVLATVPISKDVDAIHYDGEDNAVLPPVVGAIAEISERHQIEFKDKKVVVIGEGRLVGSPAALWAASHGGEIQMINKDTANASDIMLGADIIISGAGVSGLITPDKIKEGAIIFDAGTSEEGGMLRGDADPAVADKCALITPVPGGIGPVTIAVLLKNLVVLKKGQV